MMITLRHFNIFRHIRLERELATLTAKHEAMRADVVTYADIVGRQLDPRSDAGLLRRAMLAENAENRVILQVRAALRDFRSGRHDLACAELEAIVGDDHVPVGPIHLVDRVA